MDKRCSDRLVDKPPPGGFPPFEARTGVPANSITASVRRQGIYEGGSKWWREEEEFTVPEMVEMLRQRLEKA